MKIKARITFEKPANREFVIQSFFSEKDFSKNNSIKIENDKNAVIELVFSNNPPQSIIKAISHCTIESLEYSEDNSESPQVSNDFYDANAGEGKEKSACFNGADRNDDETQHPEGHDITDQNNDEPDSYELSNEKSNSANYDTSKKSEAVKSDDETVPKPRLRRGRAKPSEEDYLKIPFLDDIAKRCTNFNVFVMEVSVWLGCDQDDTEFFESLIKQLGTLNQKPYELRLHQVNTATKAIGRKLAKKATFSKHLTEILTEKKVYGTMIPFLCTVLKYKALFDKPEESAENNIARADDIISTHSEESEENSENNVALANDIINSHSEELIPNTEGDTIDAENTGQIDEIKEDSNSLEENNNLINNPVFAELFSKVDKSLPLNEQISSLYSEMGFEYPSKSIFDKLCDLTITALSMESLDSIDDVMLAAKIDVSTKDGLKSKVKISELINDFNKKNHIKRMKVIAFIRQIKTIFS